MKKLCGHLISLSGASKIAVYSEPSPDQGGFSSGGFNHELLPPNVKKTVGKEDRILQWPQEEGDKALGRVFPENNSPDNSIIRNYDLIYVGIAQGCYIYSKGAIYNVSGDDLKVEEVGETNVQVFFFTKQNSLSIKFDYSLRSHSFSLDLDFKVKVTNQTTFLNEIIYNREKLQKVYWENVFIPKLGEIFRSILEEKWKNSIEPYRIANWKELFLSTCAIAVLDPFDEFHRMGNGLTIQNVNVHETTAASKILN